MITLRSATCAATLSMWLLPGYCGCLLSLALSCTLMAIEVVFEFVLLPCLQFLLLCVALPMWLVLAYYFFEALHYVSSWCSKWWNFRSNSVSGYNRGSSYRKVRRWLRRFWLNTCENLSHSLFCVRRSWAWTVRHWAQPLRESSAAARAAFFSTRTSSSRLARRKNSRMQKKDRTRGGGEAHRREGSGLLLPFAGLGCSGFVASFCCVFGAMMLDKLPAVTFYFGVMSGALPVALATASINNNPPHEDHLQHLDGGSEGIAGTEVVRNSTSVDSGELSNGVHKRKQKMRVNYSGEMTDIQEDEEIPTASSFVVVSTGQRTRTGTISQEDLANLREAVMKLTEEGENPQKALEERQEKHQQKVVQFLDLLKQDEAKAIISGKKREFTELQREQQELANPGRRLAELAQFLDLGLKLVEGESREGDIGQEITKLEQDMLRLKYSSPLSDKLSPVVFADYDSENPTPFVQPQDGRSTPVAKQQVAMQFLNVLQRDSERLKSFAGPRYYITFRSSTPADFASQTELLTEEVFLRMCREEYSGQAGWLTEQQAKAEKPLAVDTDRLPSGLSWWISGGNAATQSETIREMKSFEKSISGGGSEEGGAVKIRKVKIGDISRLVSVSSSSPPKLFEQRQMHSATVYSRTALQKIENAGTPPQKAAATEQQVQAKMDIHSPNGIQGMITDIKEQQRNKDTIFAVYEMQCLAEGPLDSDAFPATPAQWVAFRKMCVAVAFGK